MIIKAGVWIDHHKAVIVKLNEKSEEIREINANDANAMQTTEHVQASYTRNDFVAEDKLERKETIGHNHFYDKVLAALKEAEMVIVFGPGEAKGEFVKRLEAHNTQHCKVEVHTTDKLTDNQIAAFVREHFQKS